jgi:hypothetical protein
MFIPILFVIPCKLAGGLQTNYVANTVTYQVIFHPNSIIHNNISSQVVDKRR